MRKSLIAIAAICLSMQSANAAFTPRGIFAELQVGNQMPSCAQFLRWYNVKSGDKRATLGHWILGFYTGVESQLVEQPEFVEATGSELHDLQILEMVRGFCKDNPKSGLLDVVISGVEYGLYESIKHHQAGYLHGFNTHDRLLYNMTCQNLTLERSGEATNAVGTIKGSPSKDKKFALEEWMLAAASGIEAIALHKNPIQGTQISNDDLLAQFYKRCRDNPTEYVFQSVMDQELGNIRRLLSVTASE